MKNKTDTAPALRCEAMVRKWFAFPLRGKRLLWAQRVRIFCDGGWPNFYWYPRFRTAGYSSHWKMFGFAMYLWGREINFSFGKDENGLYS